MQLEYTLDISKWRCGGDSNKLGCHHGTGGTWLLNKEGYMCCLGQFAKQVGVSEELLLGRDSPVYLRTEYDSNFSTHTNSGIGCLVNTQLTGNLIEINDHPDTTIKEKIDSMKALLESNGHTLKVINYE